MKKRILSATKRNKVRVSKSQLHVSRVLKSLGFEHEIEKSPLGRGDRFLSLDMADEARKIAIEFDGPYHYLRRGGRECAMNTALTVDGRTAFKTRVLGKMGWRVIRISYLDWQKLKNKEEQFEFLMVSFKSILEL